MTVMKRDMPKEDKAAMVRLLLDHGADMFAEDNVSADGMRMRVPSSLRRDMHRILHVCLTCACNMHVQTRDLD